MGVWWWQDSKGIAVPEHISELCARWFEDVPLNDPGHPPEGWVRSFIRTFDGDQLIYGPVPAHYWRQTDDPNFVCGLHYNTGHTSARGKDGTALLYLVEGRLSRLPIERTQTPQPDEPWRVLEVLVPEAPEEWRRTAPDEPGYVYWRSFYNPRTRTAEPFGFWLRHTAIRTFVFDNGEADYPFTHYVEPGIDMEFAPKINFDAGP